ncbi:VOC family protein [Staphylococcus lloydii]|uniref:VOC family protein n=1 Tax=Staphylococcus lloydii TaxID=2781774 RepID=UPI0029277B5B|nr:VOC family protein [Staphylococcus lloydii]MDU9418616.1 VOC family protein [Staphylococcus lloydii]
MTVKRIVANVGTQNIQKAHQFYSEILGLEQLMNHDFITTYGSGETSQVQISFLTEGGSDTQAPDLSIEVDNLDELLTAFKEIDYNIEYGPVSEPWGVRRFYVRDPFRKLVNILEHGN